MYGKGRSMIVHVSVAVVASYSRSHDCRLRNTTNHITPKSNKPTPRIG
jgi:hypothetical protein